MNLLYRPNWLYLCLTSMSVYQRYLFVYIYTHHLVYSYTISITCERETNTLAEPHHTTQVTHGRRKYSYYVCVCFQYFFFGNIIGNSTTASEMAQSVPVSTVSSAWWRRAALILIWNIRWLNVRNSFVKLYETINGVN